MLNFVLCDDNKTVISKLEKMIDSICIANNIDATIGLSTTKSNDVFEYIKTNNVDVLFLDIDLKENISGITLAEQIRKFNKKIYIIFTSAHLEYILIAYKCKTFDFLPKPVSLEKLNETILRLVEDMNYSNISSSFIRLNTKNTIINKDNINFIKKDGMKLIFYTDTRIYETYNSFNKISCELPNNFIRCHKSYIANINKISDIQTDNSISFKNNFNNAKCFIGPKYKNKLMEVFSNHGSITVNMDSINN